MCRILVAEDYQGIREVLADTLSAYGHTVIEAADGNEALRKLEQDSVDLVVTDFSMPGLTGPQLLTAMRAKAITIPVILHCAQRPEVLDRCRAMGFAAIVVKGSSMKEVLAVVQQIVGDCSN